MGLLLLLNLLPFYFIWGFSVLFLLFYPAELILSLSFSEHMLHRLDGILC